VRPEPSEQFEQMWQRFSPAVLRYARRRVAPADVDDVVAETFVVAWRRLGEAPEFPLPWLFVIARGVAANARRSGQRREALHERLVQQPAEHAAETADVPADAVAALARLGERDRELLTLLAWDDLTPQEAAEALGISHAALRVRLHRARRRFLALLGDSVAAPTAGRPAGAPTTSAPTTSGAL
jgi:RNA polymerase sigma-70 factor (ECF subfamily)